MFAASRPSYADQQRSEQSNKCVVPASTHLRGVWSRSTSDGCAAMLCNSGDHVVLPNDALRPINVCSRPIGSRRGKVQTRRTLVRWPSTQDVVTSRNHLPMARELGGGKQRQKRRRPARTRGTSPFALCSFGSASSSAAGNLVAVGTQSGPDWQVTDFANSSNGTTPTSLPSLRRKQRKSSSWLLAPWSVQHDTFVVSFLDALLTHKQCAPPTPMDGSIQDVTCSK